ncbi:cobalamin adenosyltransferase [Alkalibaculum sp. M08DMB]|uniref:Cobalamin adenosyltransferase n=1 Tax=Alkalibaculum sporogenes TaxID=2655001 RepID=A0A6A7K7X6_9FIRM|nr:cobalamin adenosyltransferase [Alkalibaculum sporogenes]MPW25530.1 cobalamin adenosyltransferase [Alkalibaculum sporogenes]
MNLVTEDIIKKIIKSGNSIKNDELRLPSNSMLTPSAKSVLADNKLKLILIDDDIDEELEEKNTEVMNTAAKLAAKSIGKFQLESGGYLDQKPEYMTQLYGNVLVPKDNKRIKLRGEVDLVMSEILKVQIRVKELKVDGLISDLQEVYNFIGEMSRGEVLNELLKPNLILGLNQQEIRNMSHNPKKYFGLDHLFNINYEIGEIPVLLNSLRARIRKVEIACYEAFKLHPNGNITRNDLMEGYNRLSSIMYIIALKYLSNQYKKEK